MHCDLPRSPKNGNDRGMNIKNSVTVLFLSTLITHAWALSPAELAVEGVYKITASCQQKAASSPICKEARSTWFLTVLDSGEDEGVHATLAREGSNIVYYDYILAPTAAPGTWVGASDPDNNRPGTEIQFTFDKVTLNFAGILRDTSLAADVQLRGAQLKTSVAYYHPLLDGEIVALDEIYGSYHYNVNDNTTGRLTIRASLSGQWPVVASETRIRQLLNGPYETTIRFDQIQHFDTAGVIAMVNTQSEKSKKLVAKFWRTENGGVQGRLIEFWDFGYFKEYVLNPTLKLER